MASLTFFVPKDAAALAVGADAVASKIMVEAKARHELGMVKPNEVFVQYTRK